MHIYNIKLSKKDKNKDINKDKNTYVGSYICMLSSHCFLFASIYNFTWKNYIECIMIFCVYVSSINYHTVPTPRSKIIDEFFVRFMLLLGVIISLFYKILNLLPRRNHKRIKGSSCNIQFTNYSAHST